MKFKFFLTILKKSMLTRLILLMFLLSHSQNRLSAERRPSLWQCSSSTIADFLVRQGVVDEFICGENAIGKGNYFTVENGKRVVCIEQWAAEIVCHEVAHAEGYNYETMCDTKYGEEYRVIHQVARYHKRCIEKKVPCPIDSWEIDDSMEYLEEVRTSPEADDATFSKRNSRCGNSLNRKSPSPKLNFFKKRIK